MAKDEDSPIRGQWKYPEVPQCIQGASILLMQIFVNTTMWCLVALFLCSTAFFRCKEYRENRTFYHFQDGL